MRKNTSRGLRFITCAALIAPVALYASDLFLGKWNLDAERSKYAEGAAPQRMTIDMERVPNGIHYHSETQWANGSITNADYVADYDEKPATVRTSRGVMLPVSLRRETDNIVTASYTRGLATNGTSRRVVSGDGRVMTITTISKNASGKAIVNVGVYRKVR
jgi:hypothetical protein